MSMTKLAKNLLFLKKTFPRSYTHEAILYLEEDGLFWDSNKAIIKMLGGNSGRIQKVFGENIKVVEIEK